MTTERYETVRRLAWLIGMVFFAHLLMAQTLPPSSYPISEEMVANILRASGMDIRASAVHLPTMLRAFAQVPTLEIVSAEGKGDGRTRIELRCRHTGDCVPFFVTVDSSVSGTAFPLRAVQSPVASRESVTGMGSGIPHFELASARVEGQAVRMQAGSQVTIVLADSRMLIQLSGIAMDAGAPGADVRICTPDRKTVFHARVVDSTIAKGVIQ